MAHLIELFVADHCPGCPEARQRLLAFAATRPDVILRERNIDSDSDAAHRYGIFATPAVVIGGRIVLYGVPTRDRLAAHCAGESPELRL
jgi:hypothetical protein